MSDEGASPREILIEACRRGQDTLLTDLLSTLDSTEKIANLLNTATDGLGQYCLHLAAGYGHEKIVDILLDQEGLEVDPIDRLEKDTPLHKAVRHINSCPKEEWHEPEKVQLVDFLTDAGADPRIRNKAKLKPLELVDPRNKELRAQLQKAEFSLMAGSDVVDTKAEEEEAEGPTGSGSESDN